MVGKENAGGGDCSGHEKRGRKECMKAEGKEDEIGTFPCSLLQSGHSKEGAWRRQGLLSEPKPNDLLFRLPF